MELKIAKIANILDFFWFLNLYNLQNIAYQLTKLKVHLQMCLKIML